MQADDSVAYRLIGAIASCDAMQILGCRFVRGKAAGDCAVRFMAGRRVRRLEKLRLTDAEVETLSRQANELPNLQLLDGSANIEKQAEPPSSWLEKNFPNKDQRRSYCDRHLLGEIPDDLSGFVEFYAARRELLRQRLVELLTATTQAG